METKGKEVAKIINEYKAIGGDIGNISDGYHTFNELYYHRMILFLAIQKAFIHKSWKSKQHHDGTMYEDYFITGIETPEGAYSYHYHLKHWDLFKDIPELDKAPKWDGHKPEDIDRLLSFFDYHRYRADPAANPRMSPIANPMANPAATPNREPMVNINIIGETKDADSTTKNILENMDKHFRKTMFNSFTID